MTGLLAGDLRRARQPGETRAQPGSHGLRGSAGLLTPGRLAPEP